MKLSDQLHPLAALSQEKEAPKAYWNCVSLPAGTYKWQRELLLSLPGIKKLDIQPTASHSAVLTLS
jgi:hypothetical protein